VILFVRDALELWPAAIAEVAGVAALAGASVWMYVRHVNPCFSVVAKPSWKLMREGATIGLSQIFWSMRMYGSTVVIGLIANEVDVGFFGGAMRILVGLHAFVWLYFFNLLPSLSRAWNDRRGLFQDLLGRSFHLVGWLGFSGGLLWVILAPTAVRLAYGEAFVPAGPVLQCLAGVCVLAAIHGHYRFGLIAAKHQQLEMITSAIGAVVALALIPVAYLHAGVLGTAIALLCGELAIWGSSAWFCRRYLGTDGHLHDLALPALITAAIGVALLWLAPSSLPALVQAGAAAAGLATAAYITDARVRSTFRELLGASKPMAND
jgi:PST family polysaccharide transporter